MPESSAGGRAAALAQLVELEARWDNTPKAVATGDARASLQRLLAKQKAFEAFQSKLSDFNRAYRPPFRPVGVTSTPAQLGQWCRDMGDLFARLGPAASVELPAGLLAKAYRFADGIARRMSREPATRPGAPADLAAAARDLWALADWCAGLAGG